MDALSRGSEDRARPRAGLSVQDGERCMRIRAGVRRQLVAGALAALFALAAAAGVSAEQIFMTTGTSFGSFDSASPGALSNVVAVTGLQGGETLLAFDCRPLNGQIYGLG